MAYYKKGPRPERWIHSDPDIHKKYIPFLRQKAQAAYRFEEWQLNFEEFLSIWNEAAWNMRGRKADSICMTRIDWEGPWSKDNVELVTRLTVLQRKGQLLRLRRKIEEHYKRVENGTYNPLD